MTPLIFLLFSFALACTTDHDCGLNGVCTNSGCSCDPGWTGDDCGILNLAAGPRSNGYNRTQQGISSWCNGIVRDPKDKDLYHLIVSEFTHGCGLDYWSPFSRVIRAESIDGPLGPYEFKQEILPNFAHNPVVTWNEEDQKYLLWSIGCQQTVPSVCQGLNFTCGPGNTLNGESGVRLSISSDLRNWSTYGQVLSGTDGNQWDADITNPGPIHVPPGKKAGSVLTYRGCPYNCSGEEVIGIATASQYRGPYVPINHNNGPIFPEASEDPFTWIDKRGNFHILVHSLLPDAEFGKGPNVGRHAYSESLEGPWQFNNNTVAYTTNVSFDDGSIINYFRRERPNIFFSDDGQMTPLFLSTGVQEVNSSASYSLIQPIKN